MSIITPISYRIHLEPDLKTFKFSASTEILAELIEPDNQVGMNILDLAIWSCKVGVRDGFFDCPFFIDPGKEELRIFLPEVMSGKISLKVEYTGNINDKMAGLYRSQYLSEGKFKHLAVTQFEESDARRAFPCFDHPAKKATFDVTMVVDEGMMAISNAPSIEEKKINSNKKFVKFGQTPKMSTYLVFFGIGDFQYVEDLADVPIRVITAPGMTDYAGFGLQFGRKALSFCEDYFGIGYPLSKLDLIAIPDFAAGAMENWGAITFRENLLLNVPSVTSKAGEERICEVIAHEMAHQWFGNLVTPSDWKYLWLNESFATYFGYGIVDHYQPEWDVWAQFLETQTNRALERDALRETVQIEIPGGEHVIINASTAPIIYSKGGSILRQVEGFIGPEKFKEGLRRYLKKHEFGSAASHHLWDAMEEVSGKRITQMMRSWVEQPGFPVVEAERDGNQLKLGQKRFSYMPNRSDQTWLIPISVRVFYENRETELKTSLLEGQSGLIDMGPDAAAYKVNVGHSGFYRVSYLDKKNFEDLGKRVMNRELKDEDRWGLQNDLYALVKSGDAPLDDYLNFLGNYEEEEAFLPLVSIANNLHHAFLVFEGQRRAKIAAKGNEILGRVISLIGFEPTREEKHALSILRDRILFQAVLYGSREVEGFALERFSSLMKGHDVHPDVMKSIMQIGAMRGDAACFYWLTNRFLSSQSEHDRMNILGALGSFSDKKLIEESLHFTLDKVPNRNKFVPLVALCSNPHALPFLWDWYRSNLEALEQFHPIHYERVLSALVPFCGLGRETEVEAFFEAYLRRKQKAKEVIKMSLEVLEIHSRMRRS